ncbi:MAG: ligase-associated DNA damage response DEXH box helicase [Saprospiraceae bacterium]
MSTADVEGLLSKGKSYFKTRGYDPFPFQENAWRAYLEGKSGIVNAPTGSGKTFSLIVPILLEAIGRKESSSSSSSSSSGLRAIWISPIRALTKEIAKAAHEAITGLGLDWEVGIRSGDTTSSERAKQKRRPPQILITTPESLHLLLASKDHPKFFGKLRAVVVDEWHELMGSKRGVQMELGLSRLRGLVPDLHVWGISATIGNLEMAGKALLADTIPADQQMLIRAKVDKYTGMKTIMPEEIEKFPWGGHMGLMMLAQVLPVVHGSGSTILFTNTRNQCEVWYQKLLDIDDDLAGQIAMHHGSIDRELRDWVEEAIHTEKLKAVVATSSLDLGVDFRPVETIVQIGSPKGVARFLQRAGRSGHRPGEDSTIYFVPTHSLELIEASALREAISERIIESVEPMRNCWDVLVQYLVTLAVGGGFKPADLLPEVRATHCFAEITDAQWHWCLSFITTGGESLAAYDEYKKVSINEDGLYEVTERRIATQHRMNMGTIVGATAMTVKFVRGGRIGTVEEYFATQLKPGDAFWFGGRSLEVVRILASELQVKRTKKKATRIPSWNGGRMSLSSSLSGLFRKKIDQLKRGDIVDDELAKVKPLTDLQAERSALPSVDEFLIEYFEDKEGHHLLMYPFEGRTVHEGMATLMAFRLSVYQPITFTIAMNDYGFELLSETRVDLETAIGDGLFETVTLREDITQAINASEMGRRAFRQIAGIAGLVFQGYPGKRKRDRQLQSSSKLFYDVFMQYEPENLLFRQAQDELLHFQLQEDRLRETLERIQHQEILWMTPERATPFAFPIMIDRIRGKFSTEKLEDRVARMKLALIA